MDSGETAIDEAVQSIYGFIRRTAEPAPVGRTWTTINYENQPHHSVSVFNGVGGIAFFLIDYYRRTGIAGAAVLAQDAVDWCAGYSGPCPQRGLHTGKTGAALAALYRSAVLNEPVPEFSLANADVILREPPGPVTDLLGGEASNGIYLLKLWARSKDERHLRGAERCGIWIEQQMVRDARGTHCIADPCHRLGFKPNVHLGMAHGLAGVVHFLLCLAEATGGERWARLSRELLETLERQAKPARGGVNWPIRLGEEELPRCQWSHGAAGIGLAFVTAFRVLRDPGFLETAKRAAEATFNYGDFRNNYTQCIGLAGGGELLLEVYRATGERRWKERATDFALRCLKYRESTPEGDIWPTDTPGLPSADFDYGAAGAGHFLLRVLSDGELPMPLM